MTFSVLRSVCATESQSWCQDAISQFKLRNPQVCKFWFGHLTTEIVPNTTTEIGSRHYMSTEISSPSSPVHWIFRFHKTLIGISMTHSTVIHLSWGLLYLQTTIKDWKSGFFFLLPKRWIHHFMPNPFAEDHRLLTHTGASPEQCEVDISTNLFNR